MRSPRDPVRQIAQRRRGRSENVKVFHGSRDGCLGGGLGTRQPEYAGVCELSRLDILSGALSDDACRLLNIEDVIHDLEEQSDLGAVAVNGFDRSWRRLDVVGARRTHGAGGVDQCARFRGMNGSQPVLGIHGDQFRASERVMHLSLDHPAGCSGKTTNEHEADRRGELRCIGKHTKRGTEQRIARQDGHRLPSVTMQRRPAAAQIIVVQRGKVIVYKRKGVHEFKCGTDVKGRSAPTSHRFAGMPGEQRTKPLSPADDRIAAGVPQGPLIKHAIEDSFEVPLDLRSGVQLG